MSTKRIIYWEGTKVQSILEMELRSSIRQYKIIINKKSVQEQISLAWKFKERNPSIIDQLYYDFKVKLKSLILYLRLFCLFLWIISLSEKNSPNSNFICSFNNSIFEICRSSHAQNELGFIKPEFFNRLHLQLVHLFETFDVMKFPHGHQSSEL